MSLTPHMGLGQGMSARYLSVVRRVRASPLDLLVVLDLPVPRSRGIGRAVLLLRHAQPNGGPDLGARLPERVRQFLLRGGNGTWNVSEDPSQLAAGGLTRPR